MLGIDILQGNAFDMVKTLPDQSIDCVLTSPPYFGLRDYGMEFQLGLESTPEEYVEKMVKLFRGIKCALKDSGTVWLNLGDSYAGSQKGMCANGESYHGKKQLTNKGSVNIISKPLKAHEIGLKPKDLIGIPWAVAFALRADGWYLRQDIIWNKLNSMPESVKDRCTKSHEYIFLLSKCADYYFDHDAIQEECLTPFRPREKFNGETNVDTKTRGHGSHCGSGYMRAKRSVWSVATQSFYGAHFATFPKALIYPCVLAGCPEGGTVLDPFFGSGTTGVVCKELNRKCIGIELNPEYAKLAQARVDGFEKRSEIASARMEFEDVEW